MVYRRRGNTGAAGVHHEVTLIATIALAFVFAAIMGYAADRLRLPPLVGYLVAGMLIGPATPGFVLSGFEPATPVLMDPDAAGPGEEVRHGSQDGPADVRLLGGYFAFDSPDAALLVSLLPTLVHVRGPGRLSALVELVGDEAFAERPGRELILARLVEVLLVESLRSTPGEDTPPGLLRGLADARVALAMRQMHGEPARPWTVAQLARTAALSRSS